jgi:probable rRNA maturation factor
MITIKNTQRKVPVDRVAMEHLVQRILNIAGYDKMSVAVWFMSEAMIRKYNATYRGKDKVTDILSFATRTYKKPEKPIVDPIFGVHDTLGDLLLCPIFILQDSPRWKKNYEERIAELLVHGICHLLGYDHDIDSDFRIMRKKELSILSQV